MALKWLGFNSTPSFYINNLELMKKGNLPLFPSCRCLHQKQPCTLTYKTEKLFN